MAEQQQDDDAAERPAPGPSLEDPSPWTVPAGPSAAPAPAAPSASDPPPPVPGTAVPDPFPQGYPMVPSHPQWGEQPATTRRWAVAGSVVFAVLAVVVAVAFGWRLLSGAFESDAPDGAGTAVYIGTIVTGDCYRVDAAALESESVEQVKLVACTEPHDGQVYAVLPLDFEDWPGTDAVSEKAETLCQQSQGSLTEAVYDAEDVYPSWFVPLEESWDLEEKTVQCVVETDVDDSLTQSYVTGF